MFLIAVVVLATTVLCPAALSADGEQRSSDTALNIFLQNVRGEGVYLKIPKDYLGPKYRDGAIRDSIYAYADFLEMQPHQRQRKPLAQMFEELEGALDGEKSPAARDPTPDELDYSGSIVIHSAAFDGRSAIFEDFTTKYPEQPEPTDSAFRRFRHTYNDGRIAGEYLIPRDEFESGSVWIYCLGSSPKKCSVNMPFGDRLWLQYAIPRLAVAEWRLVDMRVKAWVNTLVVGCFEGPQLQPGGRPAMLHACARIEER
jgi:hypothetical protein